MASGYAPEDGARPLRRVVRRDLLAPVSQAMLAGTLADGGAIVDVAADTFVLRAR